MSGPKVLAGRFSRARLLRDLRDRFETLQRVYRFDPNNGTAQLKPLNQAEKEKLPERTRAYGEWRGIETIITMIESGDLGYGD